MKLVIGFALLLPVVSMAARKQQCSTIESCVNLVSKKTGNQYLYDKELKGKVRLTKNFKITKSNASYILSKILNMNGYTSIPLSQSEKNTFQIINTRDVRYNAIQSFRGDHSKKLKVPKDSNYYSYTHKLIEPSSAIYITRSFRPFMSRYGRIIEARKAGFILIQDTGENIHRLYGLLKDIDKKYTPEQETAYQKRNEQDFQVRLLRAKHCGDKLDKEIMQLPEKVRAQKRPIKKK